MAAIRPFALPCVAYKNKSQLPASPGIYDVLNQTNREIIYIGQSKNIRARWTNHHRDYDLGVLIFIYDDVRLAIAWELCSVLTLNQVEQKRIQTFNPVLNGKSYEETVNTLLRGDDWQDSPDWYCHLVATASKKLIDSIPECEWRYLKAKSTLMSSFNYRHPMTGTLVPRYRYFEEDCLINCCVNAEKDKLFGNLANETYVFVNDDLRTVMQYFAPSWNFEKLGWSEERVVFALTTLFGYLAEANIKANNHILPAHNLRDLFLQELDDPSTKKLFLEILRPIYAKVARRNWDFIRASAVVDLEGEFYSLYEEESE